MINERAQAFGEWSLTLSEQTPDSILDALINHPLGTIYVTPSRLEQPDQVHPREVARYAGIYRKREFTDSTRTISGSGLVYLLGDQNKRGPGIDKTPIDLTGQTFVDAITAALSGTDILPGDINAEAGVLPAGQFWLQTARYKIEEICRQFGVTEYRINADGTLDAGNRAWLYPSINEPRAFIRRGAKGVDPDWRPIRTASAAMGSDSINAAMEKLLVAEIEGIPTIQGEATLSPPSSVRGPNGSLLHFTDVGAESQVGQAAANDRAAALLAQLAEPRNTVALSTEDFDVDQVVGVGDAVAVWDPDAGFFDQDNQQWIQGEWFFPLNLRIFGATWPITEGMGVYFQEPNMAATIHDLSPYFVPESGSTQLEVGAASRKLIPEPGESLTGIIAPIVNPGITPPSQPNVPTVSGEVLHIMVQHDLGTGGVPFTLEQFTHHLEVHASTTSGFTPDLTTYIGDIAATNSQISAGTPVIGVFELEDPTEYFVRVIAVGLNGLKSPASAQAPVTPGLVADAHVINLSASKITAGSLTASVGITTGELVVGGPVPKTWTTPVGTWGIIDNSAYRFGVGADSNDYAVVDAGSDDVVLEALITLSPVRAVAGVVFRWLNTSNYFRALINAQIQRVTLTRVVGGSGTELVFLPFTLTLGQTYRLTVFVSGDRMSVYIDGRVVAAHISGANVHAGNTHCGLAAFTSSTNSNADDGGSRWLSFKCGTASDNFTRSNASALGTSTSIASIVADGDGLRMQDVTGVTTMNLLSGSGVGAFHGAIDGGIIEGGAVVGAQVIGSVVSTAPHGRRVELNPASQNFVVFYSGAADEHEPATISQAFVGSGGSATGTLDIASPRMHSTTGLRGTIRLVGRSGDGTIPGGAEIESDTIGDGLSSRLWLRRGEGVAVVGSQPLVLNNNQLRLRTPGDDTHRLFYNSGIDGVSLYGFTTASLGVTGSSAGDKLRVVAAGVNLLGTSTATVLATRNDRVDIFQGAAMNGNPIWSQTAGSTARIDTGSIMSMWSSSGRTLIGSIAASNNGIIRAGIGGGHSDARNADASAYREFTAILVDASDPRLKVRAKGRPKVDRDGLRKAAKGVFLGRWKYEPKDTPPHLMVDATALPDTLRCELGDEDDEVRYEGYQNSSMHAQHLLLIEELFERIEALEAK